MYMRWLKGIGFVVVLLLIIYVAGPNPATPQYNGTIPNVPALGQLENFIAGNERSHKLRPDNEARIVWADDSLKQKTACSIVYLHGFSASQAEGDPIHRNVAKAFGCNLYLARHFP